jgi:cytochrome b involved in lipid metabolism
MAIRGKVYDVTKFISKHPGGNQILNGCGKDATSYFEGVKGHLKQTTLNILPGYYKGELVS